ncbi:putative diaminopimelate epimerase [Helianthus anomalus]
MSNFGLWDWSVCSSCCGYSQGLYREGGPLDIESREEDNHVYMMGPVEVVFFWIFSALGFVQSQNNFQILGEVSYED